ncbi:MAG: DUF1643 domain-containing protein, partial [Roseomonas mucosa]|nr:DUF1643 domain-containing protein [Roseomonas mucosa]
MASDPRRYWSPDLRRITVEEMPAPVLNLLGKEALPVFLAEDHFNQPRTDRLYLAYWWGVAMARPLICIGQNPSRASALTKDHTITVTARRAHQLGLDGLVMLNTRSFIATQPEDLYASTRDETLEFRNHQTILKA